MMVMEDDVPGATMPWFGRTRYLQAIIWGIGVKCKVELSGVKWRRGVSVRKNKGEGASNERIASSHNTDSIISSRHVLTCAAESS